MVKATFKVIAVIAHTPMQIGLSKNRNSSCVVADLRLFFSSSSEKLPDLVLSATYPHLVTHKEEVRNHRIKLELQQLAKEALPKARRTEFRLWNITGKGMQELSSQDPGPGAYF
jgi:hypothetical protein